MLVGEDRTLKITNYSLERNVDPTTGTLSFMKDLCNEKKLNTPSNVLFHVIYFVLIIKFVDSLICTVTSSPPDFKQRTTHQITAGTFGYHHNLIALVDVSPYWHLIQTDAQTQE